MRENVRQGFVQASYYILPRRQRLLLPLLLPAATLPATSADATATYQGREDAKYGFVCRSLSEDSVRVWKFSFS